MGTVCNVSFSVKNIQLLQMHWVLLVITQNNCMHIDLLGNEQWRAVHSIKHYEKKNGSLCNVVFEL